MKKSQPVSAGRSQTMLMSSHLEYLFQMRFCSLGVFFIKILKKTKEKSSLAGPCSVPWGWRRQAQDVLYMLGGASWSRGEDRRGLFSPRLPSRPTVQGGFGQNWLDAQVATAAKCFCLNMRKNFFPLRVTEPWPRLPREVVESPSLEIFKTHLDKVLCSLLWVTLLGQEGWTR